MSKLMAYGLGISVVCLGGSIWFENQIQKNYRNQEYFQRAIVLLQKYEPAGDILGRPIYSGKLNFGNADEVNIQPLSAKISIPLKGSKDKGVLYVVASMDSESPQDGWSIDQLDLEVCSTKQRWKFYETRRMADQQAQVSASVISDKTGEQGVTGKSLSASS